LLCYVAFAFLPNTSDPEEIGKIIETSTRFIDIDGEYEKGEVLIKYELGPSVSLSFGKSSDAKMKQQLEEAGVIDYVKLGATNKALGSTKLSQTESTYVWVRGYIDKNLTVIDVLANLGAITQVSHAEPNYKYYSTEEGAVEEVIDPLVSEQTYLNEINIDAARDHLESLGINPGGSRDVVVAVIDTGVDYLHEDLAPNMWVNTQEIAGNGIDDDQNGFIDDIYGVSTVSDEWFHHGNPMDDHGHGTHVAGIIAAKGGNGVGIEGVASNVRIMAIKASASSGIFLSSDIAEGVSYAYEKGADVINMSFGGYSKSYIVEDALAIAFSKAVLVAAAGNDAQINEPHPQGRDMFPAAYPWVVGVMASNGNSLASFSNFDYWPEDAHEYSITAPGTYMMSTLPNNKYAKWSGTSMSTPVVSGVAALLRSKFTDSGHNSRFIMGQLIGTSQTPIFIPEYYKLAYGVRWQTYFQVDAFNALTEVPKPNLTFYDYYVWDAEEVEATNQVNGYVDSGELIELGLYIRNHWGQARDVTVSINAISPGGVPDPYIEFITDTVNYGQVGSFSTDDNGFEYNEEDRVVGITNPFVIRVSPDTPNDYVVRINIVISGYNALDPLDETEYINDKQSFTLTVRNGYILPNLIDEDMVLTNDKYYIIPNATRIEDGVTVTVEEGTKIQFWSGQPEDPYADKPIAYLRVDGKLFFKGTKEKPIKIFPSEIMESYEVYIYKGDSNAEIHMEYTEVSNPRLNVTTISHGYFYQNTENFIRRGLSQGVVYDSYWDCPYVSATYIDASIFWKLGNTYASNKFSLDGYVTNSLFDSNFMQFTAKGENNVFLNNFIIKTVYLFHLL
jgi:subtilisin family serine protease